MNHPYLRKIVCEVLTCLCYWVLVAPLTWVVPRKSHQWTILGRNGKVLDNSKYLACWLAAHKPATLRVDFIYKRKPSDLLLESSPIFFKAQDTWSAFWSILTAGTIIVDDVDHILKGKAIFFRGARIVQLWHGVFLKKVELQKHQDRLKRLSAPKRALLKLFTVLRARYPKYDLFVSTSSYYTERVFRQGFRARQFVEFGYPRNDILSGSTPEMDRLFALNTDLEALATIREFRKQGGRVVMYAPTFRATYPPKYFSDTLSLTKLSHYATDNKLVFLIKLHPLMMGMLPSQVLTGIIVADADSDAYPLMREVDILITDYSSICYDYLLLDRPIVFYPFDYDAYITDAQNLMFDYDSMTPGPKARTMTALLTELDRVVSGQDDQWACRRQEIRKMAFGNYRFNAAERICQALGVNHSARSQEQ
jgi:CDP-glycerol glycerophosphotransferase